MKLLQYHFPKQSLFSVDMDIDDNNMWHDPWLDRLTLSPLALAIQKRKKPLNKHRVVVDCAGFDADSLKTEIVNNKLVVSGCKLDKKNADDDESDYSLSEFRRRFELPANLDADKMVSFVAPRGQLIVEIPFKRPEDNNEAASSSAPNLPTVVEREGGGQEARLSLALPKSIDPAKLQVSVKDRDVIVKYEDKIEKKDEANGAVEYSQISYYRRCTMPENTDLSGIKCVFDQENASQLMLTAPLKSKDASSTAKSVPIQFNNCENHKTITKE